MAWLFRRRGARWILVVFCLVLVVLFYVLNTHDSSVPCATRHGCSGAGGTHIKPAYERAFPAPPQQSDKINLTPASVDKQSNRVNLRSNSFDKQSDKDIIQPDQVNHRSDTDIIQLDPVVTNSDGDISRSDPVDKPTDADYSLPDPVDNWSDPDSGRLDPVLKQSATAIIQPDADLSKEQQEKAHPSQQQQQQQQGFLHLIHKAANRGKKQQPRPAHTKHVRAGSVVRECVTGDVLGELPDLQLTPLQPLPPQASVESPADRQKSFQKVFDTRAWGHGWDPSNQGLNASGMGSTLAWSQELTATLHIVINEIKKTLGVAKVKLLDVPCGDMAWIHRFLLTRDDVIYTGMDIVPDLISHHKQTYGSYTQWTFVNADVLTADRIGEYHLILCRMMMQHLTHYDVFRLLHKFSSSGSHLALFTTFTVAENKELKLKDQGTEENPGRFRALNLELPPFQLSPPECLERDGPPDVYQGWDHFIGLWRLPLYTHISCNSTQSLTWKHSRHKLYSCVNWIKPD